MKNDRLLQRDVVARLEHELHLGSDVIGVEVHHGTIKLAGQVPDAEMRKNVEHVARQVEGVLNVVVDIDIPGSGETRRVA